MENAVYAAASGMSTWSRALDITANNLANADTNGYARRQMVISSFSEQVTSRIEAGGGGEVGRTTRGSAPGGVYVSAAPGKLVSSGKNTDLAIVGEGYFTLTDGLGNIKLTRDGSFRAGSDGYLENSIGERVLGRDGAIYVGGGGFSVSEKGEITSSEGSLGFIRVTVPLDKSGVRALDGGAYAYDGEEAEFRGFIAQGMLEGSNVEVIDEMTAMITASRAFQSCSQALKMLDTVNQKLVTELGRV